MSYLRLCRRALLLGGASVWSVAVVLGGVSVYTIVAVAANLSAAVVVAGVVGIVLLADLVGALRIAHGAEHELAELRVRPVSAEHRGYLRSMLQSVLLNIANDRAHDYADPPGAWPLRERIFTAHFPTVASEIKRWNVAVDTSSLGPSMLRDRFARELRAGRMNDPPYDGHALADGLANYTVGRALRSELDAPVDLEWKGYHDDGLHMLNRPERCIDLSNVADEDFRDIADEVIAQVDGLADAAQGWPEALAVAEARNTLHDFPVQRIHDSVHAELVREQTPVAAECPGCGRAPELPTSNVSADTQPPLRERA
jgi:hypothetical protein